MTTVALGQTVAMRLLEKLGIANQGTVLNVDLNLKINEVCSITVTSAVDRGDFNSFIDEVADTYYLVKKDTKVNGVLITGEEENDV